MKRHGLIRFITAGSVDDGKSTLIGRLLYDSKLVLTDQLHNLVNAKSSRASENEIDFSFLTDGLESEREQGITIDVAYRYFSTKNNKFIIADCPGHTQYTRNMITGASNADCVILLIDVTKALDGNLLEQTKRHALVSSILDIPNVILAVNKMDLVDFDQNIFQKVTNSFKKFMETLNWRVNFISIPISALKGDNIVKKSEQMAWYGGEPIIRVLEELDFNDHNTASDFKFPIQYVMRWDGEKEKAQRAYCGKIEDGVLNQGQELKIMGTDQLVKIKKIIYGGKEVTQVEKNSCIMVWLSDEVDLARGDVLLNRDSSLKASSSLNVNIAWLDRDAFNPKKKYILRQGTTETFAKLTVDSKIDLETLENFKSSEMRMNEIGSATLKLAKPILNDDYTYINKLGALVLIDPITHQTSAALMIKG